MANKRCHSHDYRSAAMKVDAQLYKDVYDFWLVKAQEVNGITGANQTFVLQPVPAELTRMGDAKGGNAMGIPKHNHTCKYAFMSSRFVLILIAHTLGWTTLVDWENVVDDETVRSVSISTSEKWKELGKERGLYLDYLYLNDASKDQSPIATYGAANVDKLKTIALKYDPDQLFQNLQNDGFLIRNI